MGIDLPQFRHLVDLSTRFRPQGRSLMLGRQRLRLNVTHRKAANGALKAAGLEMKWRELTQDDGFSETMWDKLGFSGIETMDLSDYEGATVLHDLNHPLPKELEGQFDFIFDGGTIEHVFNVPMALTNVFRMLRPGGRFVSVNGMHGWTGHGLYQFGPELAWTFWRRACGCTVHRCIGLARDEDVPDLNLPDAAETGVRLKLRGKLPNSRVYLYYEVEKTPDSQYDGIVLQSDYQTRWSRSDAADKAEDISERAAT